MCCGTELKCSMIVSSQAFQTNKVKIKTFANKISWITVLMERMSKINQKICFFPCIKACLKLVLFVKNNITPTKKSYYKSTTFLTAEAVLGIV